MDNKQNNPGINFFSFNAGENTNTPVYAESKHDWVQWGSDNLYGKYLINLMNTSSKHNSLIVKKVSMTAGSGLEETVENASFLENEHGVDNLHDIAYKNAYDLNVYGGFCYAITWSNDKKSIARMTYMDFSKIRVAKHLDDGSEMAQRQEEGLDYYYYSADWSATRKAKNKPELIQGFSEKYKKEATQLVWKMEYRPGSDYYTHPSYISSIDWIELDKEIANFHLSSVHNGFTPSMIISFKGGVPSQEEMKTFKRQLNNEYSGTDNASRVFVTFSENGDDAPDFIPVNLNASDERFLQLEEQIQQNIIVAHGASPIVAGVAVGGKLGSSDEVLEAEMIFQKNVIDAKQSILLKCYNKTAKINGIDKLILVGLTSIEDIEEETTEVTEEGVTAKPTEESGEAMSVEDTAKANLRGSVGGVSGILNIAAQVTAGTIDRSAGLSILQIIFGLSKEDSIKLLGGVQEEITIKEEK